MSEFARLPRGEQEILINLHHRARDVFREVLARHGSARSLAEALAGARVAFLDGELPPILTAMKARATPVACSASCYSCCSLTIEITPDEALAMASYLQRSLDAETLESIKARAGLKARRSAGLDPAARHRLGIFCAALDPTTGHCMAYPVRPAACQGYLSLDRSRCDAALHGPGVSIPQPSAAGYIRDAVMSALQIVLQEAGLSQTRNELTESLIAAWHDPQAEQRWLSGGSFITTGSQSTGPIDPERHRDKRGQSTRP